MADGCLTRHADPLTVERIEDIGGTALSGGRGTMVGTLLGVTVITLIGNGLVLLGINPFFQDVIRGVIIVTAVLLNIIAGDRNARRATQPG